MSAHPPDGSDEPEAVDPVMLAVLSNRGRDGTPLSADQEGLLDDWVAGRLAPEQAGRAAALAKRNPHSCPNADPRTQRFGNGVV